MAGGGVLIVEDDDDIRSDLSAILRLKGFEVAVAANGREALEWLRARPLPAVLVLDLMMPVMNGWELLTAMRADPRLSALPVIVVSGTGEDHQALTPAAVLVKPFEISELVVLLGRFCGAPAEGT